MCMLHKSQSELTLMQIQANLVAHQQNLMFGLVSKILIMVNGRLRGFILPLVFYTFRKHPVMAG